MLLAGRGSAIAREETDTLCHWRFPYPTGRKLAPPCGCVIKNLAFAKHFSEVSDKNEVIARGTILSLPPHYCGQPW